MRAAKENFFNPKKAHWFSESFAVSHFNPDLFLNARARKKYCVRMLSLYPIPKVHTHQIYGVAFPHVVAYSNVKFVSVL